MVMDVDDVCRGPAGKLLECTASLLCSCRPRRLQMRGGGEGSGERERQPSGSQLNSPGKNEIMATAESGRFVIKNTRFQGETVGE